MNDWKTLLQLNDALIENARRKIELQYHSRKKHGTKRIRKALAKGWKRFKEVKGYDHPEYVWDQKETYGAICTIDERASLTYMAIKQAWQLINIELDIMNQYTWAGRPRAYYMGDGPVDDDETYLAGLKFCQTIEKRGK